MINFKTEKEPKTKFSGFGAFPKIIQMLSNDKMLMTKTVKCVTYIFPVSLILERFVVSFYFSIVTIHLLFAIKISTTHSRSFANKWYQTRYRIVIYLYLYTKQR